MNRIKELRILRRLRQSNFVPLSDFDLSRLENCRYNPTPYQMEVLCEKLQTTTDKLYDRKDLDYGFPPSESSQKRSEWERLQGIHKVTIRLEKATADKFNGLASQYGITQAETIDYLIKNYERCNENVQNWR